MKSVNLIFFRPCISKYCRKDLVCPATESIGRCIVYLICYSSKAALGGRRIAGPAFRIDEI